MVCYHADNNGCPNFAHSEFKQCALVQTPLLIRFSHSFASAYRAIDISKRFCPQLLLLSLCHRVYVTVSLAFLLDHRFVVCTPHLRRSPIIIRSCLPSFSISAFRTMICYDLAERLLSQLACSLSSTDRIAKERGIIVAETIGWQGVLSGPEGPAATGLQLLRELKPALYAERDEFYFVLARGLDARLRSVRTLHDHHADRAKTAELRGRYTAPLFVKVMTRLGECERGCQ